MNVYVTMTSDEAAKLLAKLPPDATINIRVVSTPPIDVVKVPHNWHLPYIGTGTYTGPQFLTEDFEVTR